MMKMNTRNLGILALLAVLVIGVVLISGCIEGLQEEEVTCNKPYIKVGNDCCLDMNDNGICDKDEEEEMPDETDKSKVIDPSLVPFDEPKPGLIVAGCTEKRITTNNAKQQYPAIYGDKIVWLDFRNGKWDIYMYNLKTNTEKRITTTTSGSVSNIPAINGDKIVWEGRMSNKPRQIYMYDLSANTGTQISNPNAEFRTPAIYGNKVVYGYYARWSDGSAWNIVAYDIATDAARVISKDVNNNQIEPAIYESKVVWLKNNDLYLYDLSLLKRITTSGSISNRPAIYGDKIVWESIDIEGTHGNWEIYMYDILKGSTYKITTNSAKQQSPAIYGDKIVWQDNRNGNWDIYQYDITTNTEKRITTNSADQKNPAIYGDKIVWMDNRSGNWDIYMYSC